MRKNSVQGMYHDLKVSNRLTLGVVDGDDDAVESGDVDDDGRENDVDVTEEYDSGRILLLLIFLPETQESFVAQMKMNDETTSESNSNFLTPCLRQQTKLLILPSSSLQCPHPHHSCIEVVLVLCYYNTSIE